MTTDKTREETLQDIGRNAMASIREMVAALECDYDRLEELRDERDGWEPDLSDDAEALADAYRSATAALTTPELYTLAELSEDEGDSAADELSDAGFNATWNPEANRYDITAPSWAHANEDDAEELKDLEEAAGENESADQARDRIMEDPLSLQVRSDWHSPGEEAEPAEYELLLSTGGPAVRIIGDLDRGEPTSATLQTQDWGTPWTNYREEAGDDDALMTYVRCFYFGE
jgi:hypothetical protein